MDAEPSLENTGSSTNHHHEKKTDEHKLHKNHVAAKNYVIAFLSLIIILLLMYIHLHAQKSSDHYANTNKFELVRPDIAALELDKFLDYQKSLTASLLPLRIELDARLAQTDVTGNYGLYIEDLDSGAWIGIKERDKFYPASLAKLPIVIAI